MSASRSSRGAGSRACSCVFRVHPGARLSLDEELSSFRTCASVNGDLGGTETTIWPIPSSLSTEIVCPGYQGIAKVEHEPADAEMVAVIGDVVTRRDDGCARDPAVEVDVGCRHRPRGQGEDQGAGEHPGGCPAGVGDEGGRRQTQSEGDHDPGDDQGVPVAAGQAARPTQQTAAIRRGSGSRSRSRGRSAVAGRSPRFRRCRRRMRRKSPATGSGRRDGTCR